MNRKTKNIKLISFNAPLRLNGNLLQFLFIKKLLKRGKNVLATRILNTALFLLEHTLRINFSKILEFAVENAKIDFDIKANTKSAIEVDPYRSINLAIKNIIDVANVASKGSFSEKLYFSILDAYFNKGAAVQKRTENLQLAFKYKVTFSDEA